MKRFDRSEKFKLRKTHRETVVKSSLQKYIVGDKEQITKAVKERVLTYSKRVNAASISLLGFIKEKFHDQKDVWNVELPHLFDQTLFRQLLLGTDDAIKPYELIKSYQERNPLLFQDVERFSADSNIYSAGAIKYITNLKNSLWMNFLPRVKQFTKAFQSVQDISDDERRSLLYLLMGWNCSNLGCVFPAKESIYDIVKQHRMVLKLEENAIVTSQWIEISDNLETILRYYVILNRYYEDNKQPTFNLVPICKIKRHFITVDSSTLYGIMKDLKMINCNNQTFQALKDDHWNSFLNIQRLTNDGKLFTGTIETDGVSLCTHFKSPKKPSSEKEKYRYDKNHRVIGIDTGRVNILSCAEVLEDGSIRSFNMTRKNYYTDTGIFKARKRSQTWNKQVQVHLNKLSKVSSKGVSVQNHLNFLDVHFKCSKSLWNEYSKERWSRSRLSHYGGKQRVWDRFFNKIVQVEPEKRVVMAFGSAKFDPTGKGEMAVPTCQVYKQTVKRFQTHLVDEFRTSKICYKDDTILDLVATKKSPRSSLRGLFWCSSTNNKFFIDRDLNAALNIRRCLISPVRPLSLSRIPGQPRIVQTISKIVKW